MIKVAKRAVVPHRASLLSEEERELENVEQNLQTVN